jgi:hypothetical protein
MKARPLGNIWILPSKMFLLILLKNDVNLSKNLKKGDDFSGN